MYFRLYRYHSNAPIVRLFRPGFPCRLVGFGNAPIEQHDYTLLTKFNSGNDVRGFVDRRKTSIEMLLTRRLDTISLQHSGAPVRFTLSNVLSVGVRVSLLYAGTSPLSYGRGTLYPPHTICPIFNRGELLPNVTQINVFEPVRSGLKGQMLRFSWRTAHTTYTPKLLKPAIFERPSGSRRLTQRIFPRYY